ncbi:SMP-30/gluconolactonase/LRE family protein [Chloroflexi bacterium TSY]|nr:SMP-30/gluconolactonase/LRE family protein [Chloroflexi bacterium TSY]
MSTTAAELVIDAKAILGEGPIWDARRQLLYWVNIFGDEVHLYDPTTGQDRAINIGQHVGTVVPRADRDGTHELMLALHHGFASLNVETEEVTMLHDPEPDTPDTRFNDGKCDPAGRFWAGTMSLGESDPVGSLYVMDTDLSVHQRLSGVTVSNGIVWSHDNRTMYFIDTPLGTVDAFDYDLETGNIENRRSIITIPHDDGYPDGMTIDAEGMLWVAYWGGYRVTRWDPSSGGLLQTVTAPAPNTSACAFGGPNLDQLYITTARTGVDDATLAQYPYTGGVFCAEVGVRGVEAFEFAG